MEFAFTASATMYADTDYVPTLRSAWGLSDDELAPIALRNLASLKATPLRRPHRITAWTHHAIQEFQDLQSMPLGAGPFPNQSNYLFHEGLFVLKEAVTAGLNNLFHGSLTLLRTSLELFLFDAWWKPRLEAQKDWERFQAWLDGKWSPPPVKNIIEDVYARLEFPQGGLDFVTKVYAMLCPYAHKPLPTQSITRVRGTNESVQSQLSLEMWLIRLCGVSSTVLDLLIAQHPVCLFPVCIHCKFGFNPPLGAFFDRTNYIPLKHALVPANAIYKEFYESHHDVRDLLDWYNSLPELSEEQILASWTDKIPQGENKTDPKQKIEMRNLLLKAKTRSLMASIAYHGLRDLKS